VKDYLIWLRSGQMIDGTMDDDEAERLSTVYLSKIYGIQKFIDIEGVLILEMENICAIGINKAVGAKEVGFLKTDTP